MSAVSSVGRPARPARPESPAPGATGVGPPPNAIIVGREDLTPAIARFVIRPNDGPLPFRAGQYFAVGLEAGGRLVQRPYSTASASGSRDLEFLVRLVEGGRFSPLLWRLEPGDRVRIGRPKGIFTLIDGDPRTHLFVATGTGIAPFVSMLHALRMRSLPARSIIVHGVARVAELAYRARLTGQESTGLAYLPVVSRPADPSNDGWTGLTGRVDGVIEDLVVRGVLASGDTVAYLCGNPAMVRSMSHLLGASGLAEEAIRSEQYWPWAPGVDPRIAA
jgi:ferredoxin--NADP+ reductase